MLQGEHSAILLTCIKVPFIIKIFVLSIFEWHRFYCRYDFSILRVNIHVLVHMLYVLLVSCNRVEIRYMCMLYHKSLWIAYTCLCISSKHPLCRIYSCLCYDLLHSIMHWYMIIILIPPVSLMQAKAVIFLLYL